MQQLSRQLLLGLAIRCSTWEIVYGRSSMFHATFRDSHESVHGWLSAHPASCSALQPKHRDTVTIAERRCRCR